MSIKLLSDIPKISATRSIPSAFVKLCKSLTVNLQDLFPLNVHALTRKLHLLLHLRKQKRSLHLAWVSRPRRIKATFEKPVSSLKGVEKRFPSVNKIRTQIFFVCAQKIVKLVFIHDTSRSQFSASQHTFAS